MNSIDLIIGLLLLVAFLMGFRRGLIWAVTSLVGILAAIYGAVYFSHKVRAVFLRWVDLGDSLNQVLGYLLTFLLILLVFRIIGAVLTKAAGLIMLGTINKILGGLFNSFKIAFLLSAFFMLIDATEDFRISPDKQANSVLYGPVSALAPALIPAIENQLEEVNLYPGGEQQEENPETQEIDSISPPETSSPPFFNTLIRNFLDFFYLKLYLKEF